MTTYHEDKSPPLTGMQVMAERMERLEDAFVALAQLVSLATEESESTEGTDEMWARVSEVAAAVTRARAYFGPSKPASPTPVERSSGVPDGIHTSAVSQAELQLLLSAKLDETVGPCLGNGVWSSPIDFEATSAKERAMYLRGYRAGVVDERRHALSYVHEHFQKVATEPDSWTMYRAALLDVINWIRRSQHIERRTSSDDFGWCRQHGEWRNSPQCPQCMRGKDGSESDT
jgi:hypothetical protein